MNWSIPIDIACERWFYNQVFIRTCKDILVMTTSRAYPLNSAQQEEIKNFFDRLPVSAIKRKPQTCRLEIKNGDHTLSVYAVNTDPAAPISWQHNPQYRYIIETANQKGEIDKELFDHMFARVDLHHSESTLPSCLVTQAILTALSPASMKASS